MKNPFFFIKLGMRMHGRGGGGLYRTVAFSLWYNKHTGDLNIFRRFFPFSKASLASLSRGLTEHIYSYISYIKNRTHLVLKNSCIHIFCNPIVACVSGKFKKPNIIDSIELFFVFLLEQK